MSADTPADRPDPVDVLREFIAPGCLTSILPLDEICSDAQKDALKAVANLVRERDAARSWRTNSEEELEDALSALYSCAVHTGVELDEESWRDRTDPVEFTVRCVSELRDERDTAERQRKEAYQRGVKHTEGRLANLRANLKQEYEIEKDRLVSELAGMREANERLTADERAYRDNAAENARLAMAAEAECERLRGTVQQLETERDELRDQYIGARSICRTAEDSNRLAIAEVESLRGTVTTQATAIVKALESPGWGHSHWNVGGAGGTCEACEAQTLIRDGLRAVLVAATEEPHE